MKQDINGNLVLVDISTTNIQSLSALQVYKTGNQLEIGVKSGYYYNANGEKKYFGGGTKQLQTGKNYYVYLDINNILQATETTWGETDVPLAYVQVDAQGKITITDYRILITAGGIRIHKHNENTPLGGGYLHKDDTKFTDETNTGPIDLIWGDNKWYVRARF